MSINLYVAQNIRNISVIYSDNNLADSDYITVNKFHIPLLLKDENYFEYYRILPDIFMMKVFRQGKHLYPEVAIILSAKHLSKHALANDGLPPELIKTNNLKVLITCVDITRKRYIPKLERFERCNYSGRLASLIKAMQFDELLKPQTMTKSAASYIRSANTDVVD